MVRSLIRLILPRVAVSLHAVKKRLPGCDEFDPPLARIAPEHLVACRKFMIDDSTP